MSGYADGKLPRGVHCPDCGYVQVDVDAFDGGRPVSGLCPQCGDRLYFDEPKVFDNCNVCGRKLHTDEEDAVGMCAMCHDE